MEVYIETVLIENFAVDFTLLSLTGKLLKEQAKRVRLILGGVIGSLYAAAAPLIPTSIAVAYLCKLFVPVVLCAVAFYEAGRPTLKSVGKTLGCASVFLGLSFAYAGALVFFFNLLSVPHATTEGGYVLSKIPFCSAVVGLVGFFTIIKRLAAKLYERKRQMRFTYPCKIRAFGKERSAACFVDSGNLAKIGAIPLCFVESEFFVDLAFPFPSAVKKTQAKIRTVGGEKRLDAYEAEEFEIYLDDGVNRIEKVYIAPSQTLCGRDYQILVGAWATEKG